MPKHFLKLIIIAFTFTSTLQSVSSQTTTTRPATQTNQRSLKLLHGFEAQSEITAVDMSRDGKTLVTASKGDIQVWNLDTRDVKIHSLLDSQYAEIKAIAISPDRQTLITGSSGLDITTQSNSSGCTSSSGTGSFSWSCNLGGSSTQTIKSTGGSAIQVWEISTGKNQGTLESLESSGFGFGRFGGGFDHLRFSADGNTLITSQRVFNTCQTKFRDLKTGKVISQLDSKATLNSQTGTTCNQTFAINPRESRQVVYASSLSIHNIGSNDNPKYLSLQSKGNKLEQDEFILESAKFTLESLGGYIAFSPDSKNIAISALNNIFIWQPEVNNLPQYKFVDERSEDSINILSFSPDSQYLAFGDEKGTIRLWDFKNSKQPNRTIAHSNQTIQLISFSPNGKTLVSVGSDRTIKIWEVN
jgi:WD40 repeat protein